MREVLIFFAVMVIGICSFVLLIDRLLLRDCNIYEDQTGVETEYRFLNNCFVKSPHGWITKDQYQSTLTAREGLKDSGN